MNCKYDIKDGEKNLSFEELYEYVIDKSKGNPEFLESVLDLVYSKSIDTKTLFNKAKEIQKKSRATLKRRSEVDGITTFRPMVDPDPAFVESGKEIISIQQLIDMDIYKNSDGKRYIVPLLIDDYKREIIDAKIKSKTEAGISENVAKTEAEMEVDNIISHWKQLEKDGVNIHILATNSEVYSSGQEYKFINKVNELDTDESFESEDVKKKLFKDLSKAYKHTKGYHPGNNHGLSNINLQEFIPGYNFELIGHIDHLFIGDDGVVHIYNFKISGTHYKEWNSLKIEKYKHELALLKWMLLKLLGINPTKITMGIIPVQIKYNDTGTKIQDIIVYSEREDIRQYELKNGSYSFLQYDNAARSIIKPPVYIPPTTEATIDRADAICRVIFPDLGIKAEAITRSAEEWARIATANSDFVKIKKIDEVNHAYDVTIGDTKYAIKDPKPKYKNEEIINLLKEHLKEIDDNKSRITQVLSDAINKGYKYGSEFSFRDLPGIGSTRHIENLFKEYVTKDPITDDYRWDRISSDDSRLIGAGIFLFKNKLTGKVDVITLSPHKLLARKEFRYNQKNLLGSYKMDTEVDMLIGDYGNIETIRTTILLNEIFPELELNGGKLGDIKIVSPQDGGKARIYPMETIIKNYMPQIFKVVKEHASDLNILNNFKGLLYMDPLESAIVSYMAVVGEGHDENLEQLKSAESITDKIIALRNIINSRLNNQGTNELKAIAEAATFKGTNTRDKLTAELCKAYLYYTGQNIKYAAQGEWSTFTNFYSNLRIPNWNIRLVLNNYIKTVDIISEETELFYDLYLRKPIMEFYKNQGYTSFENEIIGDQLRVYKNLYELDENGKNTLVFKNPYSHKNDTTYLNDAERKFLKRALFLFARLKYGIVAFSAVDENDEETILKFINKTASNQSDYFWVPLKKASAASARQNISTIGSKVKNIGKAIINKNLDEVYQQLELDNDSQDIETQSEGINRLSLTNPFNRGDSPSTRLDYIDQHGVDYFETNVETLLIDYKYHGIATDRLNEMLVGTKAILLSVQILGRESNYDEITSKELEYMIKYIKRNVFNQSIMEKTSQKIIGALSPVRTFVTYANLAGNLVSAYRDTFNGFLENYARTINHFLTDLTAENVTKAYHYVFTHAMTSSMAVSLLSKLCVKYRLSNIDIARITEGLNSNTGGAVRFDNWAFSTLRKPDFINRMVLFVARCMQDGTWDAMSMDGDTLIYDWKKDKRFNLLIKDINSLSIEEQKEYYKQRKLYKDLVMLYNLDHPDHTISEDYTDSTQKGLPDPYSKSEVLKIRDVANNIYGAYDTGLKNMLEHQAAGWAFAMYSTWMGGIWNNWFGKTGIYEGAQMQEELEIDEDGNLLYMDKDGNITSESKDKNGNENAKIMKKTPMIVQGIMGTLSDMFYICKDDGFKAMKDYINGNEMTKQNLKKAGTDLLIWALMYLLFKFLFTPEYKDYKKNMHKYNVMQNILVEILYKSTSRGYDSFKGPLNLIEFIGENTNPPVYEVPIKVLTDFGKTVFGEKTWGQFAMNNFAITRAYRDTYNAWKKENE